MAKQLNYKEAMEELERIAQQIENNEPDIDELESMVNRANELIRFCKERLRKTEEGINAAIRDSDD